jgi:hypothetical protein
MRACVAALLATLLEGCQTIGVEADFDAGADFGRYRSFSWIADEPLLIATPEIVNPLLEPNLLAMTRSTLTAKGFEFLTDRTGADFLVGFTVGPVNDTLAQGYPEDVRGRITLNAPVMTSTVDVERQLTINIYDGARRIPVWRAVVRKHVTGRDQANFEAELRKVVEAALVRFPPR